MTNNFTTIEEVIVAMQTGNAVVTKPAGIWQATELFKDESMNILRNVNLNIEIAPHEELNNFIIKPDQPWSEVHFQERISGEPSNPGESYKIWPYNNFKEDKDPYQDGKLFSHTYMERFWPKHCNQETTADQYLMPNMGIRYNYGDLNDVIKQLEDNPLTRQAYLPIFFPEDTGAVHKQRVPCTLGYLFEIWDGVLDVTYYIRSCDIFRHFRNDIYLTMRLAQYVAEKTGITVGKLNMHIANLHLFENDRYAFNKKERKLLENE